MPIFFERALFVVGPQGSGKSTQLRSMFCDARLGTSGQIPSGSEKHKLAEVHHISNERHLYLRLTSPHELGETPKEFLDKARKKMSSGRSCFAGPLQPDAFKRMPDVVEAVQRFTKAFEPERVRVVFLSPTRHGEMLSDFAPGRDLCGELLHMNCVEVACIDARRRGRNRLFLADFFDFT